MKTLKFFAVALFALYFVQQANAGIGDEVHVIVKPVKNTKKAVMALTALNGRETKLSIRNSNGETIYKEVVSNEANNARLFNFEQLAEGEYFFVVKVGGSTLEQAFFVHHADIALWKPVLKEVSADVTGAEGQKIAVNIVNQESEDITLSFYSPEGELVYTENSSQITYNKTFNFSKLGKGNYTVSIATGNQQKIVNVTL